MPQYALPLTLPAIYAEDNFFVTACNRTAHALVMRWPDWSGNALFLHGAPGSGKTHLAHIWAIRAGAVAGHITAETLRGNALVESVEAYEPTALFHLLNHARENNYFLLLTSEHAPRDLPFTLPDLTSRLRALPYVHIDAPDDEVLLAAMRKQFSDRQLKVDDEVLAYLLARSERSFAAIQTLVAQLDEAALTQKKPLTIPFVKTVLSA